jgi:transposase
MTGGIHPHLIAEVPSRHSPTEITIGIDLGDVWSHYCTINQNGDVIDRGRFRTNPQGVEKWFKNLARVRVAMPHTAQSLGHASPALCRAHV